MGSWKSQVGKHSVLGILIDAVDYTTVTNEIIRAAHRRYGLSVSPLAVHGVMTGVLNPKQRFRLNRLDWVVPDGQPVRWTLNLLYKSRLSDRVYGPTLMLHVCERAAKEALPIFLYGSTPELLARLSRRLKKQYPQLVVAGMRPSIFRRLSPEEKNDVAAEIRQSGGALVFVGLGCPRQEVWVYEFRELLSVPIIAVGAAFAFHAGIVPQAPIWMQQAGLEWLFRWYAEPWRLWRRYLLLNPGYMFLVAAQAARVVQFDTSGQPPFEEEMYG